MRDRWVAGELPPAASGAHRVPGMPEPIIALRGVTKRFGAVAAVDDVTVDIPAGRCFAWLGPNGCGKTTLIRMMLGLARPSAGEISVRGYSIPRDAREAMSRVGAIVEEPRFYPYLSGRDNLRIWAAHYGADATARVEPELARVGLTDVGGQRVKTYSLGMRQRLGVARALLNDPELLLLDEPTNGLDPAGLVEFRGMIRGLVAEGRTVFISSHILDEVERMADDVAIIQRGRMVACGPISDLTGGTAAAILARVDDPVRGRAALAELPFISTIEIGADQRLVIACEVAGDDQLRAVSDRLVRGGAGLLDLNVRAASLESRFLEITGADGPGQTFAQPQAGAPAAPPSPDAPPQFVQRGKGGA
jgi:ABC-2 type transport system ATP-binding protein